MIEVKGNGNITSQERPVSSFTRLHLSARGRMELIPSNEEKVVIETDENLQDYFEVVNSGRTLYVTAEAKLRKPGFTKAVIKIYFRQMSTLNNASQGEVVCLGPITGDSLEVKINSQGDTQLELKVGMLKVNAACEGNITLSGECADAQIKSSSEGSINAKNLHAGNLQFTNMSVGNMELYSTESISIKHMGQGYIHYYGPGKLKDIKQYGDGEVRHME